MTGNHHYITVQWNSHPWKRIKLDDIGDIVAKGTVSDFSIKCDIPRFCEEGLPKILDFGYFVLISS